MPAKFSSGSGPCRSCSRTSATPRLRRTWTTRPQEARRAVAGLGILAAVFVWRMGVAYRRYLRLGQPWFTVALSQLVVGLFVLTVLSLLSDEFFWLML